MRACLCSAAFAAFVLASGCVSAARRAAQQAAAISTASIDVLIPTGTAPPRPWSRVVLLADDVPTSYLYFDPRIIAMRSNLTGFVPNPDGLIRLNNVAFK